MSAEAMTSQEIQRGALVSEGKTKKIYAVAGDPTKAIVEYKNAITAFDDPSYTKEFATKAKHSTTTTCRVFELLQKAGVPVAYLKQVGETEFLAENCQMVPLEVVIRRYAVGSYLKRHPEFAKPEGEPPHRFDSPTVEYFLKTTRGVLTDVDGTKLVEGLDPQKGEEDPFIHNPKGDVWELVHPKKPMINSDAPLGKQVEATLVMKGASIDEMTDAITKTLLTLEAFFEQHGFKLIDFKIEFGITKDGRLVIADVIDNDSWRLRDQQWKDVSKQSFRDGEDMSTIEDKYALVASLLETSRT